MAKKSAIGDRRYVVVKKDEFHLIEDGSSKWAFLRIRNGRISSDNVTKSICRGRRRKTTVAHREKVGMLVSPAVSFASMFADSTTYSEKPVKSSSRTLCSSVRLY
jgi:hypothetical protein